MGLILRYKDLLDTYKTRGYRIRHLKNYKSLFPLKSSPLLSGIIGDLMGDGSLQGDPIWRFDFTSKNISELEYFKKRIKELFGVEGKIRKCTTNNYAKSYNLGINCSPVSRVLFKVGVPSGQKVLQNFSIPNWIKGDKECFREFCKQFFSCEASIMHEKSRKTPQIRLENWKSEKLHKQGNKLINELSKNLKKYFDIKTTITFPKQRGNRKDGVVTCPTKIYVLGDSVKKYFEEIGFSNYKQEKMKKILKK